MLQGSFFGVRVFWEIFADFSLLPVFLPTCQRGNLTATSRLFCLLPVALVASLALCFGLPEQPVEEALQAWSNSAEEYTWFPVTAYKIQGSDSLIVQWGRGMENNSVHLSASLEPSEKPRRSLPLCPSLAGFPMGKGKSSPKSMDNSFFH